LGGSELEKLAPPAATRHTTVLCAEAGAPPQPAARYLEVLGQAAELSGGRVLHTHPNGVLALFSSPDAAAAAAARMHVYAQALPPEQPKLDVRIGFHAGPVAQRNEDIFGDTVNLALQLADQARGGQILTSHDTASSLTPAVQGLVRPIKHLRVQGKKSELLLGELVWKDAVNQIVAARHASSLARAVLRVTYRGKALFRRREGDTMALGRDPQCDLKVDDAAVSSAALHDRAEGRRLRPARPQQQRHFRHRRGPERGPHPRPGARARQIGPDRAGPVRAHDRARHQLRLRTRLERQADLGRGRAVRLLEHHAVALERAVAPHELVVRRLEVARPLLQGGTAH